VGGDAALCQITLTTCYICEEKRKKKEHGEMYIGGPMLVKPTVLLPSWISHTTTGLLKICTTETKPTGSPNPNTHPNPNLNPTKS